MWDLSVLTSWLNLLALAASLWLGLYIVTRSPRVPVSWLAGLTLWSLCGYFFDSYLHLYPPQEQEPVWWMGWTILFSAPLWFHLSVLLCTRQSPWQAVPIALTYAWALALLVVEFAIGGVYGTWTGESFAYAASQIPGPLYPLVPGLMVVPTVAAAGLFLVARQRARTWLRRQYLALFWATVLALLGGAYLTISVWQQIDVPLLPGQVLLTVALVMLGYGVSRYNALIEGRPGRSDFTYGLAAIGVVIVLYVAVTHFSSLAFDISFSAFLPLLVLVVITHSLYDWGGTTLERILSHRHYRTLRANLRALLREAEEHNLEQQLQAVVDSLCSSLGYSRGWIDLVEPEAWRTVAGHPPGYRPPADTWAHEQSEVTAWTKDDSTSPEPGDGLVIPLHAHDEAIGVLVLAQSQQEQNQNDLSIDLVETLGDQIAEVIYAIRQQEDAARHIEQMVSAFRDRQRQLEQELQSVMATGNAPTVAEADADLYPLVDDALRHLYDYAYLGEHALARMRFVDRHTGQVDVVTHLDRGRALSQALVEVIERLRPPGEPPRPPTREWVQYTILYDAYVLGELNRDIIAKLYVSESSFNRARRRAVRGVTLAVQELEKAARSSQRGPFIGDSDRRANPTA